MEWEALHRWSKLYLHQKFESCIGCSWISEYKNCSSRWRLGNSRQSCKVSVQWSRELSCISTIDLMDIFRIGSREITIGNSFSSKSRTATFYFWVLIIYLSRDPVLFDVVSVVGVHYPGTESPNTAIKLGKTLWASEDYSTFADFIGGGVSELSWETYWKISVLGSHFEPKLCDWIHDCHHFLEFDCFLLPQFALLWRWADVGRLALWRTLRSAVSYLGYSTHNTGNLSHSSWQKLTLISVMYSVVILRWLSLLVHPTWLDLFIP